MKKIVLILALLPLAVGLNAQEVVRNVGLKDSLAALRTFNDSRFVQVVDSSAFFFDRDTVTLANGIRASIQSIDTSLFNSKALTLSQLGYKLNVVDTVGNYLKYYQNPIDTSLLASDAQILALENKKLNAIDTVGNFVKYYQIPVDTILLASDAQIQALEVKKANEAAMLDSLNNKVDKYQMRISIRPNGNATDDYIPTEKAVRDAIQAINIAGNYMGSSNTFTTLPTSSATVTVVQNGDWAILNATDGTNCGGIYVYNGTSYQLGKCIDDISQLTNAQSLDKTDSFFGTTSGEQLYNASRAVYNERIQIDSANSRLFSNSLYLLKSDTSVFAFDTEILALENKKLNAVDTVGNYLKYYQSPVDTSLLASDAQILALENKKLNVIDTVGNYLKYYQSPVDTSLLASDAQILALENKKLNVIDTVGNYLKYYQTPTDTSLFNSKALTLAQLNYKADISYVNGKDSVILTNAPPSVFVGRIVIDTLGTDTLYAWNNSKYDRFEAGGSASTANGISVSSNVIELGGSLTKPTTITTTATNVLKVGGLQDGSAADSILTIRGDTIRRTIASTVNLVGQITAFARSTPPNGYLALNGQTITNGKTLYPILANVYQNWVSGNNLILPNYNSDVVAGQGGYFLRGLGTRTVGSIQQDTFEQHNHQNKDVTANVGDRILAQVSTGASNTATASDATAGELNILNNYTMIPLEGGVETRPYNVAILWCVATDQVLIQAQSATVSVTNQYMSFPQVYTQTGIPTIQTPATQNEGDMVVVTSDGTEAGQLQSTWTHNGTNWQMIGSYSTNLATTNTVRTYYPSTTALQEKWANGIVTAANLTNWGFTGVGGATMIPYAGGALWNGYGMTELRATIATQTGTFTAPTSYVRQEIPITSGSDNAYFLQVINEVDRSPHLEVWICDPTTGVPLANGRIYCQTDDTNDINYNSQSYWRSPQNTTGILDAYRQWLVWLLPKSLIDANKTATNTIKLAIRAGFGNGNGNLVYVSGFAMAKADYAFNYVNFMSLAFGQNVTVQNNANGGNMPTGWTTSTGIYSGYIPSTQNRTIRIPIPDTTKDIYLTTMGMYRPSDNTDGGDYSLYACNFTLKHTSGDVVLGRPRYDIYAPSSTWVEQGYRPMGWIIPASTLAAKVTKPAGSAVSYLSINIDVPQWVTTNGHFAGFITENVSSN